MLHFNLDCIYVKYPLMCSYRSREPFTSVIDWFLCLLSRCIFTFTCLEIALELWACSPKPKDTFISCWTSQEIRATTGRWGRSHCAAQQTSRSCLRARWDALKRETSAWMISSSLQAAFLPPQLRLTTLLHLRQVHGSRRFCFYVACWGICCSIPVSYKQPEAQKVDWPLTGVFSLYLLERT